MITSAPSPSGSAFAPGTAPRRLLERVAAELVEVERDIRRLEARKAALLAEAGRAASLEVERVAASGAGAELVHRAAAAEIGFALGIADRSAERLIDRAARLCNDYPEAHAALSAGRIGLAHTAGIVEAGAVIDRPEARAAYAAEVLPVAESETPNRARRLAKILAEKHAARTMEERHAEARAERRVWIAELGDGMAELRAVMDAVSAFAIHDRLSRQAHVVCAAERAERDRALADPLSTSVPQPRTVDQARADLLVDLLLNGEPSRSWAERGAVGLGRLDARVQVTIPVDALLGTVSSGETVSSGASDTRADALRANASHTAASRGTATLAGYGAIDAETARILAQLTAGWDRVRVDAETGAVLAVDRYRPSEEIRRFLRARDQHCRYPGCTIVPFRSDADHTVDAAQGGETSSRNLSFLCKRHHTMKHRTGIGMRQDAEGVIEWTSALGRRLKDRPVSRVMFAPAGGTLASESSERPVAEPRAA